MQTTTSTGDGRIPADDVGAAICRTINVADQTLTYRQFSIDDLTPTGAQLAIVAGFKSIDGVSVLQVLTTGDLEDVRPNEAVDLRREEGRFIIVESDRAYRLTIDGHRFDLELSPLNGHIMFCLKEKKYDTKLQTCLPGGVSPTDGGIGSISQMSEAIIEGIWLPLHFDTNLVSSSRCTN